mmetsp:Transcript_41090/g.39609  ORF Transcript_41090/g.39609 Transcript_41090/m.39609 type:complete len:80 (+) Transcript_41090:545-784(+)
MAYGCFDLNLFKGISITFLAYSCVIQIVPIYSVLVNPSLKRIKKAARRAVLVDGVFYASIALAGYFATYSQTAEVVLER